LRTKVRKWGDSLAVRIPNSIALKVGLAVGDELDIEFESGIVVLMPRRKSKYRLKDLVDAITDENLHESVDAGESGIIHSVINNVA